MTGPWVILFDVDGTLLLSGGATTRCIHRVLRRMTGYRGEFPSITAGILDPQIFDELRVCCGLGREEHDRYREAYLAELAGALDQAHALPGVMELLDRLERRRAERGDVLIGVLSGNYHRGIELKLSAVGIDPGRFDVIAGAEDGADRAGLVDAAMRRVGERRGEAVSPGRVLIVGDTPRDVQCAHARGAICAAVATGRYGVEALRSAGADYVAADLTDRAGLPPVLWAAD